MEVLGVDLSTNMIDIGKQRAKEFEDDKVPMSDGFAVSISLSRNFDNYLQLTPNWVAIWYWMCMSADQQHRWARS